MWKTMPFELDAEAQGRCDCFVKTRRKTTAARARGGQANASLLRAGGTRRRCSQCTAAAGAAWCAQNRRRAESALCTNTAQPQRCE